MAAAVRSHENAAARARPRSAYRSRVVEDGADRTGDVGRVERVAQRRGTARGLGQRGGVGGDHGRAAGHGLEHDEPEPLVQRRVHERGGAAQQRVQAGVVDVAEQLDPVAVQRRPLAGVGAGEQEPVLEPVCPQRRERAHEPAQVLLGPQIPDREQVRRGRSFFATPASGVAKKDLTPSGSAGASGITRTFCSWIP